MKIKVPITKSAIIRFILVGLVLLTVPFVLSCKTSGPATTPPPTTTTTPPPTTISTTWGELAARGGGIFATICAVCHGSDGQGDTGPPILGPSVRTYGTAQVLFDFISENMPRDDPGSLSEVRYFQVLAYLLVESGIVEPETVFDGSNLANVLLN